MVLCCCILNVAPIFSVMVLSLYVDIDRGRANAHQLYSFAIELVYPNAMCDAAPPWKSYTSAHAQARLLPADIFTQDSCAVHPKIFLECSTICFFKVDDFCQQIKVSELCFFFLKVEFKTRTKSLNPHEYARNMSKKTQHVSG